MGTEAPPSREATIPSGPRKRQWPIFRARGLLPGTWPSAIALRQPAARRDGDEGDLARFDHAEAFPGDPLELVRILELLDPSLQAAPLLDEGLDLPLQASDLRPLGHIRGEGNDRGSRQHQDDRAEQRGPPSEAGTDPGDGLRMRAHRRKLQYGAVPAYRAPSPSSSSMRRSWLYLVVRSPLEGAPALICPAPVATARSAIVVSSVSPDRWEMTVPNPPPRARPTTSSVSVSVPIWFGFTRMALPHRSSIPRDSRSGLVTKRSSPTSWTRRPRASVIARQPPQSSSASGSSMETTGNASM